VGYCDDLQIDSRVASPIYVKNHAQVINICTKHCTIEAEKGRFIMSCYSGSLYTGMIVFVQDCRR
jgi:hypothetical protein